MARVTVEDCIEKVPNRFDLVMLSAQRARDIASGSPLTVERDRDKNPVVALREIADETVPIEDLTEGLIQSHQRHLDNDDLEEEPEFDEPVTAAVELGAAMAPGTGPQPTIPDMAFPMDDGDEVPQKDGT